LTNRLEGGFVEPIINAIRSGTLVRLNMTILKFSAKDPYPFRLILLIGAIMFLCSSFFIFFYTIYPARK